MGRRGCISLFRVPNGFTFAGFSAGVDSGRRGGYFGLARGPYVQVFYVIYQAGFDAENVPIWLSQLCLRK